MSAASGGIAIEQIEGRWPEPGDDATYVIRTVHRLRRVPIRDLTTEGLRMLVGQCVSLPLIAPRVLEVLDRDPLIAGDFYPGDLLVAALRSVDQLGIAHRDALRAVVERIRDGACGPVPAEVWELANDLGGGGQSGTLAP